MCRTCLFCVCLCIFIEFSLAKFVQLLNHFQNRPIDNPSPPPLDYLLVCVGVTVYRFVRPKIVYLLIWLRTRRDEGGPKKKYIFKIDGWLNGKMSVPRFPPTPLLFCTLSVPSCVALCFANFSRKLFWVDSETHI